MKYAYYNLIDDLIIWGTPVFSGNGNYKYEYSENIWISNFRIKILDI